MDLIHVFIIVNRLFEGVTPSGPVSKTPCIHFPDIDLGLPVYHPLSEVFPGSSSLGDADAGPAAHPEIFQSRSRTKQKVSIRSMGDRSANHSFDSCISKNRYPFRDFFKVWFEPLGVWRKQGIVKTPIDSVEPPGLGIHLIGADHQPLLFLAVIA